MVYRGGLENKKTTDFEFRGHGANSGDISLQVEVSPMGLDFAYALRI